MTALFPPAIGDRVRIPETDAFPMVRIGVVSKVLRDLDAGFAQVFVPGQGFVVTRLAGLTLLDGAR